MRSRLPAGIALVLLLSVSCSGNDPLLYPQHGLDQGLTAAYVAPAVNGLTFARFVVNTTLFNWDVLERLDASWRYDAASASWAKTDSTWQSVTVGTSGGSSTEIRTETVTALEVRFLDGTGAPQESLLTAARASMSLRVRQRRFALDSTYVLDEAWDITTRFAGAFGLDAGSADTLVADGSLEGWWTHTEGSDRPRVDYEGTAVLEFDFPDHYVTCPAEKLSADIRIFDGGVELDRFSGSFGAIADDDAYYGSLDSNRGPWRYAIDGNRGCPAASEPVPIELSIVRLP